MKARYAHPLEQGPPPKWATGWGQDRIAPFVETEICGVVQRFRWIPPGTFVMGSPEDEPGRQDGEGPRHEVTLSQGYWLAETPCTQALWEAVMGENPSRFVDLERPVEQVSWDRVQEFLKEVNRKQADLELGLPSEAEWEHACRAGGQDVRYQGGWEIVGKNNAPGVDEVAWYGGNSGVDFDLEEGIDSSDWEEKQFEHEKAGTRQVKGKVPNEWGLYDMLGNVLEWCRDAQREYWDQPIVDPVGRGSERCVRGGAWDDIARDARPAYRFALRPDFSNHDVGFRLSRGPSAEALAQAGGAGEVRSEAGQTPGGDHPKPSPPSGAGLPGQPKDRFRGKNHKPNEGV